MGAYLLGALYARHRPFDAALPPLSVVLPQTFAPPIHVANRGSISTHRKLHPRAALAPCG
jgi:hypothetical protein